MLGFGVVYTQDEKTVEGLEPYKVLEDGSIVVEAYRVTENGLIKLSKEDYSSLNTERTSKEKQLSFEKKGNMLPNKLVVDSIFTPYGFEPYYGDVYEERGVIDPFYKTDLTRRISEIWKNSTTSNMTHTFGCSTSQNYQVNIDLSWSQKNAITAKLGGSWNNSVSFKSETQYQIPAGKYGWVNFTPAMKNSYGYMQYVKYQTLNSYYVVSEEWTDIYIPRKLSTGNADGILECITSNTQPEY